jgi:hypothetical protein
MRLVFVDFSQSRQIRAHFMHCMPLRSPKQTPLVIPLLYDNHFCFCICPHPLTYKPQRKTKEKKRRQRLVELIQRAPPSPAPPVARQLPADASFTQLAQRIAAVNDNRLPSRFDGE